MNALIKYLVGSLLIFSISSVYARNQKIRSQSQFYNLLAKSDIAAVLFYNGTRGNQRIVKMFRVTSNELAFQQAGLKFLRVDVGSKPLAPLVERFALRKLPTIMFFKLGIPIRTKGGNIVLLTGDISKKVLMQTIDAYLGKDIQQGLKKRIYKKEEELADAYIRTSWYPYYYGYGWYPYYWNGYPYRGYYWGWPFYSYYGGASIVFDL